MRLRVYLTAGHKGNGRAGGGSWGRGLTCVSLVCAKPGAIEQQQLQPEDVINHEEDQHEEQSDAEAAAQLHGGQRHCNTNTPEASVTAKPRPHGQKTTQGRGSSSFHCNKPVRNGTTSVLLMLSI